MPSRTNWTCPGCNRTYAVPTTAGLTLCPTCQKSPPVKTDFVPPGPQQSRRRQSDVLLLCGGLLVLLLVGIALTALVKSGGVLAIKDLPVPAIVKNQIAPDPNKAKVEKWLRENLDSGKWEEVNWYPVMELKNLYTERLKECDAEHESIRNEIKTLKKEIEDLRNTVADEGSQFKSTIALNNGIISRQTRLKELEQRILRNVCREEVEKRGIRKICAIRYRTENKVGAKILRKSIFELKSDGTMDNKTDRESGWHYDPDGLNNVAWEYLDPSVAKDDEDI